MADAKRDANRVTTILAVSSADQITPILLEADPTLKALNINIVGDDVGIGGGTSYTEDAATPAAIVGGATMMERDDALATVTPAEGDWIALRGTAEGALWVQDFNSDAIRTAVETLDNAISGNEMQVDVVAALPAGTNEIGKVKITDGAEELTLFSPGDSATNNGIVVLGDGGGAGYQNIAVDLNGNITLGASTEAIGKLAANDGVDIGDVSINNTVTVDLGANNDVIATGNVAHDAADSGNPVKLGGRAQDIIGAEPEEVADNDRVDALFDQNSRLGVTAGSDYKYADINDATSGNNTIVAAQAAGKRIAVWAWSLISDGTVDARWEDGAGGTAFTGQYPFQAREGISVSAGGLVPLFVGTAATLLNLELSAAVNVHGHVAYTVLED